MKYTSIFALILAALLLLCGCGRTTHQEQDASAPTAEPTETAQPTEADKKPVLLCLRGIEKIRAFIASPELGDEEFGRFVITNGYVYNGVTNKDEARGVIEQMSVAYFPVSQNYPELGMEVCSELGSVTVVAQGGGETSFRFLFDWPDSLDNDYIDRVSAGLVINEVQDCGRFSVDRLFTAETDEEYCLFYAVKDGVSFAVRAFGFESSESALKAYDFTLSKELPEGRRTAFIVGDSSEVGSAWHKGSFFSQTAPEEATVEFCGQSFTGEYTNSRYESYDSYVTDYYGNADGFEFGLKENTNELVFVNALYAGFEGPFDHTDIADPEERTEACAKDYAGLFINVDEYATELVTVMEYGSRGEYYTYEFARSVSGVSTMDKVTVQVDADGNLSALIVGDPGAYDAALAHADEIAEVDIEACAAEALSSYHPIDYKLTGGYELKNANVAVTPEGRLVICGVVAAEAILIGEPENTLTLNRVYIIYV